MTKAITCAECKLAQDRLKVNELRRFTSFAEFEFALEESGPWIAGIDFPFGQPRKLIENLDWPRDWCRYVDLVGRMERQQFRDLLDAYKAPRKSGDKEHRRSVDAKAGSISPQKQYGVPVALMFFEGAPRIRRARVSVPLLQDGDLVRIVVEAYPGVRARKMIGKASYKQDTRSKQTEQQSDARRAIFRELSTERFFKKFGFLVEADPVVCDDPTGDELDAVLCAVQAAWAWRERDRGFGIPDDADRIEGWIVDPALRK